jgi:hypothetical protein
VHISNVTPLTQKITPGKAWIARGVARRLLRALCGVALMLGAAACSNAENAADPAKVYRLVYGATLDPKTGLASVTLTLKQPRRLVRSIEFVMPPARYLNIQPAEAIEVKGERVTWRPRKQGGVLRFDFVIGNKRANGAEDARIEDTWALLKLDKLFPPASARVVKGATSKASLQLVAPKGWAIETPYGRGAGKVLAVSDPRRLFDRPLGWLLAGKLGVRRDNVGERIISVASPLGANPRANDVLTFVRRALPALLQVFPEFPQRLLIVSGSDEMWRGGLSGRGSLYLHPDRPLISGNRTSPILHELFHVASRLRGTAGSDWIVEGLAEYYSLELLLRSDGISERRFNESLGILAQWSADTPCAATDRSQGKQTARAVLVMHELDKELRAATKDKVSLDALVKILVGADQPVTNADFQAAAKQLLKRPAKALAGCP